MTFEADYEDALDSLEDELRIRVGDQQVGIRAEQLAGADLFGLAGGGYNPGDDDDELGMLTVDSPSGKRQAVKNLHTAVFESFKKKKKKDRKFRYRLWITGGTLWVEEQLGTYYPARKRHGRAPARKAWTKWKKNSGETWQVFDLKYPSSLKLPSGARKSGKKSGWMSGEKLGRYLSAIRKAQSGAKAKTAPKKKGPSTRLATGISTGIRFTPRVARQLETETTRAATAAWKEAEQRIKERPRKIDDAEAGKMVRALADHKLASRARMVRTGACPEPHLDRVARDVRAGLGPRLKNIVGMLDYAAQQRTATSEHRGLVGQAGYRRRVLSRLAQILKELPEGDPVRARILGNVLGAAGVVVERPR